MAGILHLVCGKIAAGKSTLCARLAATPGTILIAQDPWMKRLWGEELSEVADYLRLAPRLNSAMAPLVAGLLAAGLDVVLDFPANTATTRAWWKSAADRAGAAHRLHWLDVADEVCRERLRRRNAQGEHEFAASDSQYDEITRYFEPPAAAEGLVVVLEAGDG
jgi:predicted kinase